MPLTMVQCERTMYQRKTYQLPLGRRQTRQPSMIHPLALTTHRPLLMLNRNAPFLISTLKSLSLRINGKRLRQRKLNAIPESLNISIPALYNIRLHRNDGFTTAIMPLHLEPLQLLRNPHTNHKATHGEIYRKRGCTHDLLEIRSLTFTVSHNMNSLIKSNFESPSFSPSSSSLLS